MLHEHATVLEVILDIENTQHSIAEDSGGNEIPPSRHSHAGVHAVGLLSVDTETHVGGEPNEPEQAHDRPADWGSAEDDRDDAESQWPQQAGDK